MLRWKVAEIRKCRKMDLRKARSAVGVANSRLRLLETQDAIFAFKIKFWCQKWIPKAIDK